MSNNQLAGFPAFGSRVDSRITYNIKTITYDPAVELPTSIPASPQVSLQITSADLPSGSCLTWDADDAFAVRYVPYIYVKVDNLSGGYANYYASIQAGAGSYGGTVSITSVINNAVLYAYEGVYQALDAYVNVKLNASVANCYLTKAWLIVVPNYMKLAGIGRGFADLEVDLSASSWIGATAKTATGEWTYSPYGTLQELKTASFSAPAGMIGPAGSPIYGLGRVAAINPVWYKSATSEYNNWQPYYPTRIAYTPIL